jgi:RNA polymerase sigma-70 factor (ECF subfamily)
MNPDSRAESPPSERLRTVHRQRRVVEAYLTATRRGDFDALLALLDPNVVLHADRQSGPTAGPITLNGAR